MITKSSLELFFKKIVDIALENYDEFNRIKSIGFSDKKLSKLTRVKEKIVQLKVVDML